MRLKGFAPVLDASVRIVVLGSFPSAASLSAAQYYGHPRNQFWRLLGAVLDEPLHDLAYPERLQRMLLHRVGLWDVVAACARQGSADSAIRDARFNNLDRLMRLAPSLCGVLFNGATAGKVVHQFSAAGFATAVLPSSSPAHAALTFEQKLARWRRAFALTGLPCRAD